MLRRVPSLVVTAFVLTVVSMNLLANKELFHTDWIALDCGFTLSWIPFLIMDCICWLYGGKTAARLSILAVGINLLMFGIFKLVLLTPGMWGEYYVTEQPIVNEVLNRTIGGSTWIVLGSALAMLVALLVNSFTNIGLSHVFRKQKFAHFAVRSFTSTGLSQFVDNLVFALVVSVPLFGWTMRQTLMCALTCAMAELILEICFSPLGYVLTKQAE